MVKIIAEWRARFRALGVATGGKIALKSQAIEQKPDQLRSTIDQLILMHRHSEGES
jgi:hypothetical protein